MKKYLTFLPLLILLSSCTTSHSAYRNDDLPDNSFDKYQDDRPKNCNDYIKGTNESRPGLLR